MIQAYKHLSPGQNRIIQFTKVNLPTNFSHIAKSKLEELFSSPISELQPGFCETVLTYLDYLLSDLCIFEGNYELISFMFDIGKISSEQHQLYLITCKVLQIFANCSYMYYFISTDASFRLWLISLIRPYTDNYQLNLINFCIYVNVASVLVHIEDSEMGNKLLLKCINETNLLQIINVTLIYSETIQLLDALMKHASLVPHILQNDNFNLTFIVKSIFDIFEANEISNDWSAYLSLLKTIFQLFYTNDKIPDFPEIQFPSGALKNKYKDLFIQILDFLSIYAVIPNSYFQQFFNFFVDSEIDAFLQKRIFNFFKSNFIQFMSIIDDSHILKLVSEKKNYLLVKRRMKLLFLIQEKIPSIELDETTLLTCFHFLCQLKKSSEQVVLQYLKKITETSSLIGSDDVLGNLTYYIDNHNIFDDELRSFLDKIFNIKC